MSQWGTQSNNAANSALWGTARVHLHSNTATQNTLFGNTSPSVWKNGNVSINMVRGQFGVSANNFHAANSTNNSEVKKVGHTGWNIRTQGTGPVTSITVSAGGTGYSNTDKCVIVPAGNNGVNATATLTTNSTGGITSVTLGPGGAGFVNNAIAQFKVVANTGANSAGTNAAFTFALGGRAGRVHYETLVAQVSMKGPSANQTLLPG